YGDAVIRWLVNTGRGRAAVRWVESSFARGPYATVFVFPGALGCAVAGSTGVGPLVLGILHRSRPISAALPLRQRARVVARAGECMRDVALPLLAAAITRDPALVAAVSLAGRLPWLVLSLVSGALVDRVDRRWMMGTVDVVRAVVMVTLAVTVAADVASIAVLCGIAFALG